MSYVTGRARLHELTDTMKAFILDVDSDKLPREVEVPASGKFNLEEIYKFIDTQNLEFLMTHNGDWLVVDEDANLQNPPPPINVRATLLYKYGYRVNIRGKVFVCKFSML